MYLDASAILAILNHEEDAEHFQHAIDGARPDLVTSAVTVFEAALGLARAKAGGTGRKPTPNGLRAAAAVIDNFLGANDVAMMELSPNIGRNAVEAAARYGKIVGHPADLNFGDCFVYACAKARDVPLLFKGDDFGKTDIEGSTPP
jgi:ribonuclease VapC